MTYADEYINDEIILQRKLLIRMAEKLGMGAEAHILREREGATAAAILRRGVDATKARLQHALQRPAIISLRNLDRLVHSLHGCIAIQFWLLAEKTPGEEVASVDLLSASSQLEVGNRVREIMVEYGSHLRTQVYEPARWSQQKEGEKNPQRSWDEKFEANKLVAIEEWDIVAEKSPLPSMHEIWLGPAHEHPAIDKLATAHSRTLPDGLDTEAAIEEAKAWRLQMLPAPFMRALKEEENGFDMKSTGDTVRVRFEDDNFEGLGHSLIDAAVDWLVKSGAGEPWITYNRHAR